jgi:NAD(P)-dependent dehydrogenase (short-subunit alcohol dehydrogenase family)
MDTPRVMVLTGCASGIGRHLVGALAARGHRVVATDIDEARLAECEKADGWPEERVLRQGLDVRSEADWEAALDAAEPWGGADVLLNVAGYLKPAWVQDIEARDIDLHLGVNVKGTMLGTRAAARRMLARGRGHIVNIGSLASLAPVPGLGLYSASKFAVRGFSLAADTELRPRGVPVSLVMPDAVQTPMLDLQVDYEEAALTFSGSRPLTVQDIAAVLLDEVLPKRPLEITIPLGRGAAARLANSLPAASRLLAPFLAKKGKKTQEGRKRHGG